MLEFSYILILSGSIACLLLLDYTYKLAFFCDWVSSVITIFCSILLFTIWDILGIHLGIFFSGQSKYALNMMLFAQFPLEEVFFLFLLSYVTLLLYRLFESKPWQRT